MKQQRDSWFERLMLACGGDLRRLLFLDETGASTSMIRTYGRSIQGQRCVGSAPGGHWKTMTGVAAIRLDGLSAAATMAHAMDGDSFLVYLTHALLPVLSRGDVVAMDNLPGHKLARVREWIESVGGKLLYLPAYSPDLNPIKIDLAESQTAAAIDRRPHDRNTARSLCYRIRCSNPQRHPKLLSAPRVQAMTFCTRL